MERVGDRAGPGCGCEGCASGEPAGARRRGVLGGLLALGSVSALGLGIGRGARAADTETDPKRMRPQPGDILIFERGDRKGEPIAPGDIAVAERPVFAFPFDPVAGVSRDGTRLNRVLVLRLADAVYSEETRARAADGVIAYSAVCTHQKCTVIGWHPEDHMFICPCHETNFDPSDGARVVSGPARKRLPALPLKVADGVLSVAGAFTGRVGGPPTS